jgi:hypothetical protein
MVLLASLLATGTNFLLLKTYFSWNYERSGCEQNLQTYGFQGVAESALQKLARDLSAEIKSDELWQISIRAEGRVLLQTYRFNGPIADADEFHRWVSQYQKVLLEGYCADNDGGRFMREFTQSHTYYNYKGERLTSFSLSRADCPRW